MAKDIGPAFDLIAPAPTSKASGNNRGLKTPSGQPIPKKVIALNLTPLTGFKDNDEKQLKGTPFADNYTRLVIRSNVADISNSSKSIPYAYEYRSAFARYFWGETLDINLSLNVVVGQYNNTIPLVSLSRESDSKGQYWSRTIYHNALAFPWFLVKNDGESSVPIFKVTLRGTQSYQSGMAAAALQVAVGAIQDLSPSATLLTKLNAPSEKSRSNAVDAAIGKLFSNGIAEQHITERNLRLWHYDGGVQLTLKIPKDESQNNWNKDLGEVGTWIVQFDSPRPSIFYDERICNDSSGNDQAVALCKPDRRSALAVVHKHIDASSILNFHLYDPSSSTAKDLGTIKSYLSQQAWFSTALTSFKDKEPDDGIIAGNLCRQINNSMISMGLNSDDAAMVIWALVNGYPLPSNMHSDAFQANSCKVATDAVDNDRH